MRKWSSQHVTIAPFLLLKEKWLDEKISVLKYVASFKDRLFRAGQKAKRNLQKSKSKYGTTEKQSQGVLNLGKEY